MTKTQKIIKYCAIALAIFLIASIFSGIIGVVSSIFSAFRKTDDIVGEMMFYGIFNENDIKNLDVSASAATLEIKNGEAFSVESNHKYLKVEVKNGALIIEDDVPFRLNGAESALVVVTIPSGFTFERAEIETGAGSLNVEALCAKKLRLELGAGESVFENLRVTNRAEIQTGVGKFSVLDGAVNDLEFDGGVGDVSLKLALTGECEWDCGIGNTEITLLGAKEIYSVSVEKGLGSATVDGKSVSNDESIGNGAVSLDIDGGIGNITVAFAE